MNDENSNKAETSCWNKSTKLKQGMYIASGVIICIILLIFLMYASILQKQEAAKEVESPESITSTEEGPLEGEEICLTSSCIHTASKILKFMDQSVDPCDDFYQFACGGFLDNTIIPEGVSKVSWMNNIEDVVETQFKTILEQPLKPEEPKAFKVVKRLYYLCMDTYGIEADGFKPLTNLLNDLGKWPLLEGDNWKEIDFDWKEALYKFRRAGLPADIFLTVDVLSGTKSTGGNILRLTKPTLNLPLTTLIRSYSDAHVQAYFHYLVDVAVALGVNRGYAQHELKQVVQFEVALAKIWHASEKYRREENSTKILTIFELHNRFPEVPWLQFFENIVSHPDIKLSLDEPILIENLQFINGLLELLKRAGKRVQGNYALFKAVIPSVRFLTKQLRDRGNEFKQEIEYEEENEEPRWKECIRVVHSWFERTLLAFYVRNYFDDNIRTNISEMVSDIQEQFISIVENSDWMDNRTKTKVLQTLDELKIHIIYYSNDPFDDYKLEKFYKTFDADYDSYLTLILRIQLFKYNRNFGSLRNLDNEAAWTVPVRPKDFHMFYSSIDNSIEISAVAVQDILYNNDRPKYMNYGAIGQLISHELVHILDELAIEFNSDSMEKWGSNKTEQEFIKRAKCVQDQYGKIMEPRLKIKLNGTSTKLENIADITGIKLAYSAYKSWIERNNPEPSLPGLDYNPEQLFWISAATIFCEKQTNGSLQKQILKDSYSPSYYRVQIPFASNENFAKDFKCSKGSVMYPINTCKIW